MPIEKLFARVGLSLLALLFFVVIAILAATSVEATREICRYDLWSKIAITATAVFSTIAAVAISIYGLYRANIDTFH